MCRDVAFTSNSLCMHRVYSEQGRCCHSDGMGGLCAEPAYGIDSGSAQAMKGQVHKMVAGGAALLTSQQVVPTKGEHSKGPVRLVTLGAVWVEWGKLVSAIV